MRHGIWLYLYVFIIILSLGARSAFCAEQPAITDQIKTISNEVLKKIFIDVYVNKRNYEDLENFSDKDIFLTKYDIILIKYAFLDPASGRENFAFAVTILPLQEPNVFQGYPGAFEFGFPVLGIKFAGYQTQAPGRPHYDIDQAIRNFGKVLWLEQQRYLPLQLSLVALKPQYKKGESITFRVVLKNTSGKNLAVKDLNAETLFFVYNNKVWGASQSTSQTQQKVKTVILKPGQTIQREFAGNSFFKPQEIEIFCTYNLTYEGVNPSANLVVKVVE